MLDPEGCVVLINTFIDNDPEPRRPLPHPAVPTDSIDSLRVRYLGPDRRAGRSHRNTSPSGEDAIFQAAGFLPEQCYRAPDDRVLTRTIDDVVASVLSMSSTAPNLFGDDFPRFESDLRRLLLDASPNGLFSVALRDNSVRVWRQSTSKTLDNTRN